MVTQNLDLLTKTQKTGLINNLGLNIKDTVIAWTMIYIVELYRSGQMSNLGYSIVSIFEIISHKAHDMGGAQTNKLWINSKSF